MYLNKAFVLGNLTRDPELKALPSGTKVCSFSVATNQKFKDKDGAWQEKVEFHNVVAFGTTAENVGKYLRKGSQVLVEGRIQTRNYENKDGLKIYRTEVVADVVQFGAKPVAKPAADGVDVPPPDESSQAPSKEVNPDDIPF